MRAVMYCSPRSGSTWLTRLLEATQGPIIRIEDPEWREDCDIPSIRGQHPDATILISRVYSQLVPYLPGPFDPRLPVLRLTRRGKAAQARSLILADRFGVCEAKTENEVAAWRKTVQNAVVSDEEVAERAEQIALWDQRTAIWACESKRVLNVVYEDLCDNTLSVMTDIMGFFGVTRCKFDFDVPLRKLT